MVQFRASCPAPLLRTRYASAAGLPPPCRADAASVARLRRAGVARVARFRRVPGAIGQEPRADLKILNIRRRLRRRGAAGKPLPC